MKGYGYIEKKGDNKWLSSLKKYCNEQNLRFSLTNPLLIEEYYRQHPEAEMLRKKKLLKSNEIINTNTNMNVITRLANRIDVDMNPDMNIQIENLETKDLLLLLIKEVDRVSKENVYLKREIEFLKDRKFMKPTPNTIRTPTEKTKEEKIYEWIKNYETQQQQEQQQEKNHYVIFLKTKLEVTASDIEKIVDNVKQPITDIINTLLEGNINEIKTRDKDYVLPVISFQEKGSKQEKVIYVYDIHTNEKYKEITKEQIVYLIKEINNKIMRRIVEWKKTHERQGTYTDFKEECYFKILNNACSFEFEKLVDKIKKTLYKLCMA
jgi:hypothetical protein